MHGVITGLKIKLHYSPDLYLGEGINFRKLSRIKKKIFEKPLFANFCLIALAERETDQLEIISTGQLIQSFYQGQELKVVGLAKTKDDALSLVLKMTEDCLANRKDCSLKEFLSWQ